MKLETLAFLDGLCLASGMMWTEAGMSYSHAVQPRTIQADPDQRVYVLTDKLNNGITFAPDDNYLTDIARFLRGAFGDLSDSKVLSRQRDEARRFVERLHIDLAFDSLELRLEEDSYGMDMTLDLFTREIDTCVRLEIGWAID